MSFHSVDENPAWIVERKIFSSQVELPRISPTPETPGVLYLGLHPFKDTSNHLITRTGSGWIVVVE